MPGFEIAPESLLCYLIVAVLAIVQSIFGIGLLILGTPILLLVLGFRFDEALWVLLPASVAISTLQLLLDRRLPVGALRSFVLWAVPPLLIGLAIALKTGFSLKIDYVVAIMLIVGGVLRLSNTVREIALRWLRKNDIGALAGIGLVHGLTNMGGGLLSLYASIRHTEKYEIRQHIALGYATFALTQLAMLAVAAPSRAAAQNAIIYLGIAAAMFVTVGRRAFAYTPGGYYNVLFSVFEIGCAGVLITRKLFL